jgi:hypothetical protein
VSTDKSATRFERLPPPFYDFCYIDLLLWLQEVSLGRKRGVVRVGSASVSRAAHAGSSCRPRLFLHTPRPWLP